MAQPATALSAKMGLLKTQRIRSGRAPASSSRAHFTARLEPGKTPTTRSRGKHARPRSATTKARSSSSSGISRCRPTGRRPPPTLSPANTSTASWARRTAKRSVGAAGASRGRHHRRLGHAGRLLPDCRGRREFPRRTGAPDAAPEGLLQLAGVVQRRGERSARLRLVLGRGRREGQQAGGPDAAAMLGLLHRLGEGFARIDSRSGQDRRHAVQMGLGHGLQPVDAARRRRDSFGRRPRLRSALVHEGLRRLCRRDQVRRQDAARGQDGDPQRRPSRHRRLHLVQGQGREEGAHAGRGRLRLLARRRRLQLHLLPERQQFRARHRRIHAGGGGRRRVVDQVRGFTASR